MAESPETGREAPSHGVAGQRGDAEGGGLPEAAGGPPVASADPAVDAGKVTGDPENRPDPAGFGPDVGDSGGKASRSLSDAREGAVASAGTGTRKNPLRRLLGRLRGSSFRERPKSGPESAVPPNLRPWTGEVLPHVRETRDDGPIVHFMDLIAWHTTLPADRYILHAERRRRRRESRVRWALRRFAATVGERSPACPPWLERKREREDP
ncbi:MAG: hypothetical protein F4213_07695 [Boseongicola sp. SB0677_bin_26]|nr:hypothetical protein [Boseongicola sp. SB0665_bin_10]MYG25895.1 hypothetical protein [Boseongicola sp. SB0677_bin_26]